MHTPSWIAEENHVATHRLYWEHSNLIYLCFCANRCSSYWLLSWSTSFFLTTGPFAVADVQHQLRTVNPPTFMCPYEVDSRILEKLSDELLNPPTTSSADPAITDPFCLYETIDSDCNMHIWRSFEPCWLPSNEPNQWTLWNARESDENCHFGHLLWIILLRLVSMGFSLKDQARLTPSYLWIVSLRLKNIKW